MPAIARLKISAVTEQEARNSQPTTSQWKHIFMFTEILNESPEMVQRLCFSQGVAVSVQYLLSAIHEYSAVYFEMCTSPSTILTTGKYFKK